VLTRHKSLCLAFNPTRRHGFDGVYLDGYLEPDLNKFSQCTRQTTAEGCTSFMKFGRKYDIDGDGVADTADQVYSTYFAWATAFVSGNSRSLICVLACKWQLALSSLCSCL
jgi:hypothetical protein